MKIGILKETKTPVDKRVPLTPEQCKTLFAKYPLIKLVVQPSPNRCYMDEEYEDAGILLDDNVEDCDVLVGIKEVKPEKLIPGKTYVFFSHTAKKQPHNRKLLHEILKRKITLIDLEYLRDNNGIRLLGFGHWAGIIGAYNGFRGYCIRYMLKEPKPAHTCVTFKEFKKEVKKIELPPVKIVVTGNGRVAKGVLELLELMGIREVNPDEYLQKKKFSEPVYVHLDVDSYNKHKEGKTFEMSHFFAYPREYQSDFLRFAKETDYLIMSAFWDPNAPALFTKEDMKSKDFRIKVIADITCDINGAIPSTLRPSIIEDPFYGYNPKTELEELAFKEPGNITMMTVDNLPNELPCAASEDFGSQIIEKLIPEFISDDNQKILNNATIAKNGKLMPQFSYLQNWVDGEDK